VISSRIKPFNRKGAKNSAKVAKKPNTSESGL
jgi:hypothetical protein